MSPSGGQITRCVRVLWREAARTFKSAASSGSSCHTVSISELAVRPS